MWWNWQTHRIVWHPVPVKVTMLRWWVSYAFIGADRLDVALIEETTPKRMRDAFWIPQIETRLF
jgi:hypothetical protein